MVSPSASKPGFQFITSINTIARNDETRRRVRSHARRQKLPSHTSTPQPKRQPTQKERISKFRLSSGTSSGSRKKRSTSATEEGCSVRNYDHEGNPGWETTMISKDLSITVAKELPNFSLLRIETTPLTENLLKYCMTINVDTAATHAFMANVAAMHNSLADWDDTTTIDFHRFQAVKTVNERLNLEGKDIDSPVSDGLIIAVALLVNTEAYIGSLAAAGAHMNGLKRMVEMRGGLLQGFEYSSLLQRTMAWADFSYATAANKPLVFPLIPKLATSLGIKDRFMSRSMVANTEAVGLSDLSIRHREVMELFELLYSITDGINSFNWADIKSFKAERSQISDSIYLLEWRLCQLEDSTRSQQGSSTRAESLPITMPSDDNDSWLETSPPTDLSNALIYASHLFLHLAIRGQPPAAHRHRALIEALMSSLCDTLMMLDLLSEVDPPLGSPASYHTESSVGQLSTESWSTTTSDVSNCSNSSTWIALRSHLHENILLWILFVGFCIRMPNSFDSAPFMYRGIIIGDHHEFFSRALAKYCRVRSILDKDTLLLTLKEILWLDSWCETQLNLFWQEISDQMRI
ncbi:hypothetical protein SLS62_010364 [Diatrype stigma]|uniref:Uncharacterized protein n=1 Tax=Diatrype stigma TaxID=117547 RepID=A0AAN9YGL4_9PEZI